VGVLKTWNGGEAMSLREGGSVLLELRRKGKRKRKRTEPGFDHHDGGTKFHGPVGVLKSARCDCFTSKRACFIPWLLKGRNTKY